MKRKTLLIIAGLGILPALAIGCKPKTTAQKIEDKAEDAGHEMKQGVERAGENIENATKRK